MKTQQSDAQAAQRQPAAASNEKSSQSVQAVTEGPRLGMQEGIDHSPRALAQRRAMQAAFGEALQRQPAGEDAAQGGAEREPITPPNQTGMPNQLKAGIESLSGMDMSEVRVHRNSGKPAQLNALAYAQGNDIHLGPGQEQHLPHEAWHVVQQRQGQVPATMQMAGMRVNDDVGLEAEADLMGDRAVDAAEQLSGSGNAPPVSQRMASRHRQPLDAFGAAIQLREEVQPGPFQQKVQAGLEPHSIGLMESQQMPTTVQGEVHQLARWKDWGAKRPKKGSSIFFFNDEGKARIALTAELGVDVAEHLEVGDWELGLRYAMDREEGADSALKLLSSLAAENLRKARIAERRQRVVDTGLLDGIDDAGFNDIATQALKLGVSLYIEGNRNGSIGNGWSRVQVNDAINELDYDHVEIIKIAEKEDDDLQTGIVIRDAHRASNKTEQDKGSDYRGADVQANVNMYVLGKLAQVHLNVG